jgi:hypothetical protein
LSSGIKGATQVMCIVEFPVVKLQYVFLDHKLEQASKNVSTKGTTESLHDPKELGNLQIKVRR